MKGFRLDRTLARGAHPLAALATGLQDAPTLRALLGDEKLLRRFLDGVRVRIVSSEGYMWIDDEKGELCVSQPYLVGGDESSIYVDLVHELVHIRQYLEGKELFDQNYTYVDRPTELEAYRASVAEARGLGWSEAQIAEYLRVPWTSEEEHRRLCRNLGVKPP